MKRSKKYATHLRTRIKFRKKPHIIKVSGYWVCFGCSDRKSNMYCQMFCEALNNKNIGLKNELNLLQNNL